MQRGFGGTGGGGGAKAGRTGNKEWREKGGAENMQNAAWARRGKLSPGENTLPGSHWGFLSPEDTNPQDSGTGVLPTAVLTTWV